MYQKLTEKILGFPLNDFASLAMSNGSIVEQEAIPWYMFAHDTQIDRVGFCTSDDEKIGFSPDGLIGEDGGIEVKSPTPQKHLEYLLEGELPKDYRIQIQFALYVSGRKWWKFLSYSRQFPALVLHVERDEKLQAAIAEALDSFLPDFDAKLAHIKSMKDAENALRQAAYDARPQGRD